MLFWLSSLELMVFPLSSDFTSWCTEMTPNISTKPQEYQQNPYEIMGMHTILGRYSCITLCDPCWRWVKLLLWLYCGNLGYRAIKQYWQKLTVIEGNNKLLIHRKFRNSKKTTCSRPKAIEGEEMKVGKGRLQGQGCELLQRGGCPKIDGAGSTVKLIWFSQKERQAVTSAT